ncbi:T9SS type B sorting domain-containing protein [Telluribacter humicola]|uniref:T9SS type B sorting domain-containing protein n=1 Tax=Telluribacter humicola TaxID=1720261 RepID=UPI001A964322|nr:gliding motility-associated C-terminal domain-containing protein [Telluribacter humicola]
MTGLLISLEGQAQLCELGGGGFIVTPTEGCAPLTVVVEDTVKGSNPSLLQWAYNYQGGNLPASTRSLTHTYTKPGTYTILQAGSSTINAGFTACKQVKVLDTTPLTIQATACADGKVKLTVVDDSIARQYDQIEVDWRDGSGVQYINKGQPLETEHTYTGTGPRQIRARGVYFGGGCNGGRSSDITVNLVDTKLNQSAISQVESRIGGNVAVTYTGVKGAESEVMVKSGGGAYEGTGFKSSSDGSQQMVVPSLDPNQVYSFQIKTTDICGNSKESNQAWTTSLTATPQNQRNILNWSKYPVTAGFTEYQVLRNGSVIKTYNKVDSLSFADTNVQCGETYRYQVITRTAQVVSISAPIEVTAVSNESPAPITQAFVSVEQNGSVSILVLPPATGATTSYKVIIERAESGSGAFQELVALTNSNRYTDATAKTSERSYCYRITYENACGNRSTPTEPICTVWLQHTGTLIRWTGDKPFTDQVGNYFVVKISDSGPAQGIDVGTNTSYNPQLDSPDEQEYNYQVRVHSRNGSFISYSNQVFFRQEAALFLPDAFSPNGDGKNDVFQAKGIFFDSFQMLIYNRWGEVVYSSTDSSQGWDGLINGERAPEGNYIYRVEIKDSTSKPFVKSGSFLLLR